MDRFRSRRRRKISLFSGIFINLGILFFYKYYEFAGSLITDFFSLLNIGIDIPRWNVLLPVGISFYIFQAVGYAVDVYRGTIKAEKNFVVYALFISFFPQLVAGPIERAKNMLPQFREKHKFSYENFDAGLRLMIWGFFMKLCVADRVSTYVDAVYNNYMEHSGVSLLLATFFFTFQIYCDFAGYSLIAIGSSKMMGFTLMENFHRPYFAKSIKEFWRRWHISLSSWFKEYVYIPLGGNRKGFPKQIRNILIVWLLTGFWHGASWNFVAWGLYFGVLLIVEKLFLLRFLKKLPAFFQHVYTMLLVMLGWAIFSFDSLGNGIAYIRALFGGYGQPIWDGGGVYLLYTNIALLLIAAVGSTPLPKELWRRLEGRLSAHPIPLGAMETCLVAAGMVLSIAFLVDASYNPFLYFRF